MSSFFGHEKQWQLLKKSAELNKVSHAYLFSGKSQLGKKEMAGEFSKLLNCQSESSESRPCRHCQSCLEMEKGLHPDFLRIEVKDETGESEIDTIKNLAGWLCLKPGLGKRRLVVINQIQDFSFPAQSALLKTLEEPRGEAVLILISDYPELLLGTIASRVQEIKFYCLAEKKIIEFLVSQGVDKKLAGQIGYLSLGKPLKAMSLLDSGRLKREVEKIAAFKRLLRENLAVVFKEIGKMAEENEVLSSRLESWLNILRIIFLERVGVIEEEIVSREEQITLPNLKKLILSLEKASYLLSRTNASKKLVLENSILELY